MYLHNKVGKGVIELSNKHGILKSTISIWNKTLQKKMKKFEIENEILKKDVVIFKKINS